MKNLKNSDQKQAHDPARREFLRGTVAAGSGAALPSSTAIPPSIIGR